MRANNLITATAGENGVIVIRGMNQNTMHVLGCSAGSSLSNVHGSEIYQNDVDNFCFTVSKGKVTLIALHVYDRSTKNGGSHYFFLTATWPENTLTPRIDLENDWIPTDANRTGQGCWVASSYSLVVNIDGLSYTNAPVHKKDDSESFKMFRYVPNGGDLLCRYLLGEVEARDVKDAAIQPLIEPLASEQLAIALEKNSKLNKVCNKLSLEKAGVVYENIDLTDEKRKLEKKWADEKNDLEETIDELKIALSKERDDNSALEDRIKELLELGRQKAQLSDKNFEAAKDARKERDIAYKLLALLKKELARQKVLNETRFFGRKAVAQVLEDIDLLTITNEEKDILRTAEGFAD